MTVDERRQESIRLIQDTIAFKKTKRVPILSNASHWPILDSDYNTTLSKACSDFELNKKISKEFFTRFRPDTINGPVGSMGLHNYNLQKILGHSIWEFNDEAGVLSMNDFTHRMNQNEYDELVENEVMFIWTRICPREFGKLTYGQLHDALKSTLEFNRHAAETAQMTEEELGIPRNCDTSYRTALATLMYFFRGMKYLSLDMRKNATGIDAYIQNQEPSVLAAVRNAVENPSGKATVALTIPMVAHCITNNKQFERFYWPTLKKCIDMVVEADKQFFIFCEADILRLKEFFQDIPKGHGLILCEQDSIYDVRKEMPNFAVAGGMPGSLLGYSSKQECVDYAKKLIDDMGDGYVFSTQKILAFKNDAKRENLMAVYDFIYNYAR